MKAMNNRLTLDPIYPERSPRETACKAHILPQAICTSNAKVISNKKFDNDFGRLNDAHAVRWYRKEADGSENVKILSRADKQGESDRKISAVLNQDQSDKSEFQLIVQYPKGTIYEWQKHALPINKLVEVIPDDIDERRVILSMLHSAYLAACSHYGDEYVTSSSAGFTRALLIHGLNSTFTHAYADILDNIVQAVRSWQGVFSSAYGTHLLREAICHNPHPIIGCHSDDRDLLLAVLHYSDKIVVSMPLPWNYRNNESQCENEVFKVPKAKFGLSIMTPIQDSVSFKDLWEGVF